MTWHSGEDIIKDLAVLDDFDAFKNERSSNFLYSIGRGGPTSKSKHTVEFIDPRTGEAIDISDEFSPNDYDAYYKTKGRGSIIGFTCRTKALLQKQLRLARPLGSGDEVIESYFRRNQLFEEGENSVGASDWESEPRKIDATEDSNSEIQIEKPRVRVKAMRNSNLQHNVLIDHLSKCTITSEENFMGKNIDLSYKKHDNSVQQSSNLVCNDNLVDCESDNDNDIKVTNSSVSSNSN